MGTPQIITHSYPQYNYFELREGATCSSKIMHGLTEPFMKCVKKDKKVVVCFPHKFKLSKKYHSFFEFIETQMADSVVFTPKQQELRWSAGWKALRESPFMLTDYHKAIAWATGKIVPAEAYCESLGGTAYVKCAGNLHQDISLLSQVLHQAIKSSRLPAKFVPKPMKLSVANYPLWSYIRGGLVIDLADVFVLTAELLVAIEEVFENHDISPVSEGVYFITSGLFQSWILKKGWGNKTTNVCGNIVRVVTQDNPAPVKQEIEHLAATCQELSPPLPLFVYQVDNEQQARQLCTKIFPDMIIVDELSIASNLETGLPEDRKENIYRITPSTDPSVRILSSQLITQGYDHKLFAEYLVSRYYNKRGRPNDTNIYYLDSNAESLHKAISLLQVDFAHVLNKKQTQLLQHLAQCETQTTRQGHFLISLLETRILNLKINLPFTSKGAGQMLSSYPTHFPKQFHELCTPLRLFLMGDSSDKNIDMRFYVVQNFSEILISQNQFKLDMRIEKNQAMLTIQSEHNEQSEKRCLSLFTLLNATSIFACLPQQEILIDIISLLLKNVDVGVLKKSIVINLVASSQATELKVFHDTHNKIFLKVKSVSSLYVQLVGDTAYTPEAQRRLLKLIGLFFAVNPQDDAENNWRFACFEVLRQVCERTLGEQVLSFDFKMNEDRWTAMFVSNAQEDNAIPDTSIKVFESGADKVLLDETGRRVTLLKNPSPEDLQESEQQLEELESLTKELDNLQENNILREVEEEKAKRAVVHRTELLKIYDMALQDYNQKFGDMEMEEPMGLTVRRRRSRLDIDDATTEDTVRRFRSEEDRTAGRKRGASFLAKAAQTFRRGAEEEPKTKIRRREAISADNLHTTIRRRKGPRTLEEAAHTDMLRGRRARLMSRDNRKTMKRVYIALGTLAMLGMLSIWLLFTQTARPPSGGLVMRELDTNNLPAPPPPAKPKPVRKAAALPKDSAAHVVKKTCMKLFRGVAPDQGQLNELLRFLYQQKQTFPDSGDIYNLIGRAFWYKIYLDRNSKLYSRRWIKKWKHAAQDSWQKAQRLYERNAVQSTMRLFVQPWMPEKRLLLKTDDKIARIEYDSLQTAISDMQRLQNLSSGKKFP